LFSAGPSWAEFYKCCPANHKKDTNSDQGFSKLIHFCFRQSGGTPVGNSRWFGCGIGRAGLFFVPGLEEA
jgi:hypothetical protein